MSQPTHHQPTPLEDVCDAIGCIIRVLDDNDGKSIGIRDENYLRSALGQLTRCRANLMHASNAALRDAHLHVLMPRELFLELVFLNAVYAGLLNTFDGGERKPLPLPVELSVILTGRVRATREHWVFGVQHFKGPSQ